MPRRNEDLLGTGIDALVPFRDRLQLHTHRGVGTTPMAISVALSPRLSWQMRVIRGMWHVETRFERHFRCVDIRQLPAQSASFQANPFFNLTGTSFIRVIPPACRQGPENVRSRNPNRVWHMVEPPRRYGDSGSQKVGQCARRAWRQVPAHGPLDPASGWPRCYKNLLCKFAQHLRVTRYCSYPPRASNFRMADSGSDSELRNFYVGLLANASD